MRTLMSNDDDNNYLPSWYIGNYYKNGSCR